MKRISDPKVVENIIDSSPEGKNTKFLSAAHSLWFRFKNYETNPPFVLESQGAPVSLIFATYSNRTKYMNLYEIVTIEGQSGKGYASKIWDEVISDAVSKRMSRVKLSCTPSSIGWHLRNGLVFWGVDKSGSLRSDQPLYSTRQEQIEFRNKAVLEPSIALPSKKVCEKLIEEDILAHGFGNKKMNTIREAINATGEYWLRDYLIASKESSLEGFI